MEKALRKAHLSLPQLSVIAGTLVLIGAGLGLLLAERLQLPRRRTVGWTLFFVGALSTVPLAFEVLDSQAQVVW